MTPILLNLLCDPATQAPLELLDAQYDERGNIISGSLRSPTATYPIVNGIPRFVHDPNLKQTVESFGDEWNHFNFRDFKQNWMQHTVRNTFGSTDAFKDKIIVDAGGGSGSQTLWMLESGAKHVILLDLSHSVDDVVQRNLKPSGYSNYDVVQCSIDAPPIKHASINGIVICHNVIQHTPSVERTARALYALVAPGSEFVFNCYPLNDRGAFRWIRFHLMYKPLRWVLSRQHFRIILAYSQLMGVMRQVPLVGWLLEKCSFCTQGDVPYEGTFWECMKQRYRNTVLNTFDGFGSHEFQHHKSHEEIKSLVRELQPVETNVLNTEKYFSQPPPIGCALRVIR